MKRSVNTPKLALLTAISAIVITTFSGVAATANEQAQQKPLIIVEAKDKSANRNVKTLLKLYATMITNKKPAEVKSLLSPDYIQHNPILPTGPDALVSAFTKMEFDHPTARVVVHRMIASGDYVFAHVNFINIFTSDPADRGQATVDVYRFDKKGIVQEHWDVIQNVPDPAAAANTNGMF